MDLRIILSTGLLLVGVPSSFSCARLGLCPPVLDIDAVEVVVDHQRQPFPALRGRGHRRGVRGAVTGMEEQEGKTAPNRTDEDDSRG